MVCSCIPLHPLTARFANASAKTILVGVDLGLPHFDSELQELGLLAHTAGMEPVARITCKRRAPDAALFVGSGKADEIKLLATQMGPVKCCLTSR